MLKPDYDLSIVSFVNTVIKFLGATPFYESRKMQELIGDSLSNIKKVIIVIIDSLGYEKLSKINNVLQFERVEKIFSVFPTTTVTAVTSLVTGLTPQEHGLMGYIQFLREIGMLLNMIDFSYPGMSTYSFESIVKKNLKRLPNVFQLLKKEGKYAGILTSANIANSGLSFLTQKDASVMTYYTVGDLLSGISKILRKEFKGIVFVYYGLLDGLGHKKGPDSESYEKESEYILREIKRIVEEFKDKHTRVFITADHGMVQTPRDKNSYLGSELRRFLRMPPTGEMRMMYFYTKYKREKELIDYLQGNYKGRFELFNSKEMLSDGYFGYGKLHPEVLNRIGDIVLVCKENYSFTYLYTGGEDKLKGMHGSLTEKELHVPLIVL
ncbi:alkaline phosphatase family protein [Thermosipho ferrireducens]|uniref:Alkaline phosphatase family protein n=1 Tax=Thermosipho ferrireducens TaxID=2571116 RepID=A0ABX7SA86_9BACT|nr:alkaline phosphatase family protein [Thermosipho ferrireducens]QTA38326.1 alkaline phosphatase family protein [Thermosipho ferrireducens]